MRRQKRVLPYTAERPALQQAEAIRPVVLQRTECTRHVQLTQAITVQPPPRWWECLQSSSALYTRQPSPAQTSCMTSFSCTISQMDSSVQLVAAMQRHSGVVHQVNQKSECRVGETQS